MNGEHIRSIIIVVAILTQVAKQARPVISDQDYQIPAMPDAKKGLLITTVITRLTQKTHRTAIRIPLKSK